MSRKLELDLSDLSDLEDMEDTSKPPEAMVFMGEECSNEELAMLLPEIMNDYKFNPIVISPVFYSKKNGDGGRIVIVFFEDTTSVYDIDVYIKEKKKAMH
tara:strand:- start:24662 stop:24961 length:300 start_codon:yes stop_codon:yes gene_type:complete